MKDGKNHPSHQIQVLRRRGADAWTEARPVLETLLAIYQVCPHDFLYWSYLFSFLKGKQYAANQKLFLMNNLVYYRYDTHTIFQPRVPHRHPAVHDCGLLLWGDGRLQTQSSCKT